LGQEFSVVDMMEEAGYAIREQQYQQRSWSMSWCAREHYLDAQRPRAAAKSCFFAEARQLVRMQLPISSIERVHNQLLGLRLEASNIDVVSVGVGPRDIERLYAAGLTELVLSDSGIERVRGEIFLAP
jgi:hypothetical protein